MNISDLAVSCPNLTLLSISNSGGNLFYFSLISSTMGISLSSPSTQSQKASNPPGDIMDLVILKNAKELAK